MCAVSKYWVEMQCLILSTNLGGYGVATGGPLAWGLCYNKEESPMQSYCDDSDKYKLLFPCAPGADYYGRGAIPIYWCVFICDID